tara:strand:- start:642 stop:833 length:192 start_codon:yes stop_codon:yes gene_type:complete
MIVGFILLMVSLNPAGEVEGTAVDYFKDPYSCVEMGYFLEESAPMGIGFVCIEDYVEISENTE